MALTRSRATASSMAPSSPHTSSVSIPIRFQCPLCLDVLRRPIQLPCCQRYLWSALFHLACSQNTVFLTFWTLFCDSMECFERGLELTSVNCGFCRRRVVGFARTKQYKIDEVMWNAIKNKCPFLGEIEDDREPLVEFFDEDAPPLHSSEEEQCATSKEASGALKTFYKRQLLEHQSRVQEAEQRALQQTIDFLQNDPEFTASLAASSSPVSSTSSSMCSGPILSETSQRTKKIKLSTTASTSHRPVTRSLNAVDEKQPNLDDFFRSSRATSSHSRQDISRAISTTSNVGLLLPHARSSNPQTRKYFLRSASHSPTPIKERRRQRIKGRKSLLQLTLDTTISPIALHTRSRDLKRASSIGSELEPCKMLTRQGRRRRSWKCAQCTYTNTCFDNRCSMCRSLPPPETLVSLNSQ